MLNPLWLVPVPTCLMGHLHEMNQMGLLQGFLASNFAPDILRTHKTCVTEKVVLLSE